MTTALPGHKRRSEQLAVWHAKRRGLQVIIAAVCLAFVAALLLAIFSI